MRPCPAVVEVLGESCVESSEKVKEVFRIFRPLRIWIFISSSSSSVE